MNTKALAFLSSMLLGIPLARSLVGPLSQERTPSPSTTHHASSMSCSTDPEAEGVLSRRKVLTDSSAISLAGMVLSRPITPAHAADSSTSTLTVQSILQGLRTVPTFCIVNDQGAAYMLYKPNEGFAKGYAFMTYEGADVVLKDAIETAEKGNYADTWKTATITVVPADIAMRLTLQPRERTSQKDQKASTILFLIPGASDREAAIQMDRTKFSDQGKVPVFYLDTYRNNEGALPLYFNPRDLVADWQRSTNADSNVVPPRIQVIDLVTMFGYVVRERTAELPAVLRNNPIVFVPNPKEVQKAKEMQKNGNLAPYKLDTMVV